MQNNSCATCIHYREFEGVCTNADSDHVADFINPDSCCEKFTKMNGTNSYEPRQIH